MTDATDLPSAVRLCLFCEHFNIDMGHPGYSELTPGYDAIIRCGLNHWEASSGEDTHEFIPYMLRARTCPDFNLGRVAREVLSESML